MLPNPLLVGVDVHRQTNTVWLMDPAGHVLGPRRTIANNRPGAAVFVRQLAHQMAAVLPNPRSRSHLAAVVAPTLPAQSPPDGQLR